MPSAKARNAYRAREIKQVNLMMNKKRDADILAFLYESGSPLNAVRKAVRQCLESEDWQNDKEND